MKVLIVGGGGREHAIGSVLSRSPSVQQIVSAPGNPGLALLGHTVPVKADAVADLVQVAIKEKCDLVVVGPEIPLVNGIADQLSAHSIPCFGPTAAASRLEGSKAFSKSILDAASIPTARYRLAKTVPEVVEAAEEIGYPVVIKADGLAAGKGVRFASTHEEARLLANEALVEGIFGDAGKLLLVEEMLEGKETSVFALSNGADFVTLPSSRDYKRLLSGDQGPNTGGMGAYAPIETNPRDIQMVEETIIAPTLSALQESGSRFQGLLYCGLMWTREGPRVLEFNCRFGDPETQALLPLFKGDLGEVFLACARGEPIPEFHWKRESSVVVVLAAPGYPANPRKGVEINGVEMAAALPGVSIFHLSGRVQILRVPGEGRTGH